MDRPPNILLILTDQQRFDTIAALGNPLIRTPAVDRLVREGTAFVRAYTPSPVCVSARCALATGLPPHVTGCVNNMPMPPDRPSFMEALTAQGYQTHGVGKMHFTPELRRLWGFGSRDFSEEGIGPDDDFRAHLDAHGYGHVDEPHGLRSEYYYIPQPSQLPAHLHHTTWVGDRSLDFLQRRERERPFFLWTSFIKPHPPFEAPTPWNRLYRCAEMPLPFRPEGYESLLSFWNHVQNRYKYRDAGRDDLLLRTMRAAYYACISFIDAQIARILAGLGEEIDRTLILFTSDHGEMLGDYGSFGKRCMLDVAARVPLLARWPGHFPSNARCETPASLLDICPTLRRAAGIADPSVSTEGTDLREIAAAETDPDRIVYSQFGAGAGGTYLAVSREWKYVYSAPDHREWLFDLEADARETVNRASNPMFETTLRSMRSTLIARFRRDGYREPLDGERWRHFPAPRFPSSPDAGLLFQDARNLEERIASLGEYARPVSVRGRAASRLLSPETDADEPHR
jgi:arylsulfatase